MQNNSNLTANLEIGLNIIENITTGMYRDSLVVFRECIQNSCDQIDQAVEIGLLAPGEGQVEIWIGDDGHSVSVEDNATGINASEFKRAMYSIGVSSKPRGKAKGFRGIGHWCGLGYCKTLVFTAKAKGENVESIMTCDAEKIRAMMDEYNTHTAYYTVAEALEATTAFSENKVNGVDKHYFKVEMLGISNLHSELCHLQQVKEYLSFVAPVGYANTFRFRNAIHKHAEDISQPIQEYNVSVNGERIFKKYTPSFTTSKGDDTITSVDFKDFRDDNGNIVAWLWFGISRFQGVIKKDNPMRGIRLRTQNIQIGDDNALQKLFNEDRGQHYFVGEVFAIAEGLIPNSQRDYYNANDTRSLFEHLLSDFFNDELSRIYKAGSAINSKYDKIQKVAKIEAEISSVRSSGAEITEEQLNKLERAKKEAETATQELDKIRQKTASKIDNSEFGTYDVVVNEIIKRNDKERTNTLPSKPKKVIKPVEQSQPTILPTSIVKEKSDKLISLSKVCKIIRKFAESSIADAMIAKIEEELD